MSNDREHFDNYKEQTRAKHLILTKYLFAFFNVLKGTNKNLVYIDGFAGRGSYTDQNTGTQADGSPLLALRVIAQSNELAAKVATMFAEKDSALATQLATRVRDFYTLHSNIREPRIWQGEFEAMMNDCLDHMKDSGARLAPSFLFVDPCGVAGASFAAIKRFMSEAQGEVLVFFNLDGVRRILGLGDRMGATLAELLGSAERAQELAHLVAQRTTPAEKEQCIVAFYEQLIRTEIGAPFITTFRVEKEDRRTTSHYLIHVTRHARGFAIMKDVMWREGKTAEGKGGLAYEQASLARGTMLVTPQWDAIKQSILTELAVGLKKVEHFYKALTERPDNLLCEDAYRRALLELEAEGAIEVIDKQARKPMPAAARPKKKGVATLARDYHVRLRGT